VLGLGDYSPRDQAGIRSGVIKCNTSNVERSSVCRRHDLDSDDMLAAYFSKTPSSLKQRRVFLAERGYIDLGIPRGHRRNVFVPQACVRMLPVAVMWNTYTSTSHPLAVIYNVCNATT
jgi:hypothetical protein